jgi:rhodanese-related sulfurtransferase
MSIILIIERSVSHSVSSIRLSQRSGKRSAKAAALMKVLGFRDIYDIEGGIIAWEKQGLPVTE